MFMKSLTAKGYCNFTQDPEVKTIGQNKALVVDAAFNVSKDETYYAKLTFWGNDVTAISERGYGKGDSFYIEGGLKLNPYVNKQGNAVCKMDISVTEYRPLTKKERNVQPMQTVQQPAATQQPQQNVATPVNPAPTRRQQGGFNNSSGGYNNSGHAAQQQNMAPPIRHFQGAMPYSDEYQGGFR